MAKKIITSLPFDQKLRSQKYHQPHINSSSNNAFEKITAFQMFHHFLNLTFPSLFIVVGMEKWQKADVYMFILALHQNLKP